MEFELKELGQTLAVGGLGVFGVIYILRLCKAHWVPKIPSIGGDTLKLHQSGMIIVVVLATGIILEDISEDVANRKYGQPYSAVFNWILDSKQDLRFRSLFNVQEYWDKVIISSTPSYHELRNYVYTLSKENQAPEKSRLTFLVSCAGQCEPSSVYNFEEGKDRVAKKTENGVITTPKDINKATDALYYQAKNLVYRYDTYNSELRAIESRIIFIRATIFVCYSLAIAYALVSLLCLSSKIAGFLSVSNAERNIMFRVTLLYILFIIFLKPAYKTSGDDYNKRVFGYYLSILMDPGDKKKTD